MKIEGRWIFSGKPIRVETDGPRISGIHEAAESEGLPYLAPGLVDLQVNGYRGIDYSSPELKEGDVEELVKMLAVSGTTQHVPTIITNPRQTILRSLSILTRARRSSPALTSAIPGYHIEGPFISSVDGPRGAHSPNHVRAADVDEFREWQEAADGDIRIVTIAPEIPGAIELIEEIARSGVLVSIGHSGASPEQVREAVAAGARLSTHLGNGSHATIPR
ncbi:MAG TPA: N-acetylglucosamine-6-phosphate deacetylase, partial [Spirochaetia bacterium]|nr:N-acetylglucosamine-6-phosphate deacetylase [Spirochaetia bacterium]